MTVNNTETINVLLERVRELENEVLVLQQLVDSKEVAIDKLQDSVQNMESEKETSQMQSLLDALSKVTHLEEHIARRDQTIQDLENEIELNKSQALLSNELQDILSMKDEELRKISENCRKLEEELAEAKELSNQQSSNEETKYKDELQKKEEVFESHSKFMKSKV
jgi:predicted transcriptional regulator